MQVMRACICDTQECVVKCTLSSLQLNQKCKYARVGLHGVAAEEVVQREWCLATHQARRARSCKKRTIYSTRKPSKALTVREADVARCPPYESRTIFASSPVSCAATSRNVELRKWKSAHDRPLSST